MRPRVPSGVPEGLLFALLAFGPLAFGSVEPWSRATLEILAFALAFACFLRGRPAVSTAADNLWLLPAGFAALGVVQILAGASADGPRPLGPFTAAPRETESAVLLWSAYAAVLWSVPRTLVTHEAARRYARFVFGLGLAVAALGMLQLATGGDKLYWLRVAPRAYSFGPYYNRDHAANLLLVCLAFSLGVLFSRSPRRPGADGLPRESWLGRALVAGGVLFLLCGVYACGSRGALLAVPLAGGAVALLAASFQKKAKARRARAAAALAGLALVVALAFRVVGAGADAGALVDPSVTARFFIYVDAGRWLRDAPLFGTGLGSFEAVYPSYQDPSLRGSVKHAHSDWLELALETGLLGLLAALLAAAWGIRAAVRTWLRARSSEMRSLIGGGLAATAAFAAHSLFEFGFQIPGNAVVFFSAAGFLLSSPAWADKGASAAMTKPPPAWALPVGAACFLVLTWAAAAQGFGFGWQADAKQLSSDAVYLYMGADQGGAVDQAAVRGALELSLASTERRPYDSGPMIVAAASLRRLGRDGDAAALFARASSVRFSALEGSGPSPRTTQSKLESLRGIGLLPTRLERP